MIAMKLATAGLLGMVAVSALAQAPSMNAGARDIVPADTSTSIKPALPGSGLGVDASSSDYLRSARDSLASGRTGQAQQSLEMAETRALAGSDTPDQAKLPSGRSRVAEIRNALHALGNGDRAQAIQMIDVALSN
jgi:hypothetical protein